MKKKKKDSFLKQAFVTQTLGYTNVFPKREIWSQIGKELNGTFKIVHNSGYAVEKLILHIPYKSYEIKLSESDTRPLKFELDFDSELDYELVLSWEDSISKLLKRLGKRDVEIGNEKFDNQYLIETKDTEKTLRLFTGEIIDILLKHKVYSLSYITDKKKRKSKLTSTMSQIIDDKETILVCIELHKRIIDKLIDLFIIK